VVNSKREQVKYLENLGKNSRANWMQSNLPRYIILTFVIAVFIYDQVAYYYFPINEFAIFVRVACISPTFLLCIGQNSIKQKLNLLFCYYFL